jgi:DnaK suppressor protein
MMPDVTAEAKVKLTERRAALSRSNAAHRAQERTLDASPEPDWPDRAAVRAEEEVLHKLTDRELTELREIDAALTRIELRTFGDCERCDKPIGRQRLLAMPETRHCIDCAD